VILDLRFTITLVKRSSEVRMTKGQTMICKTLHIKLKIDTNQKQRTNSGAPEGQCSTCDTGCVTLVTNSVVSHKWGKDRIMIPSQRNKPVVIYILKVSLYTGKVISGIPIEVSTKYLQFSTYKRTSELCII
jgi:hypothetical protein